MSRGDGHVSLVQEFQVLKGTAMRDIGGRREDTAGDGCREDPLTDTEARGGSKENQASGRAPERLATAPVAFT